MVILSSNKPIMLPFTMKSSGLPTDLPLTGILPLEEYIGTSGGYWKIYRTKLSTTDTEVSVFVFDKAICSKLKQQKKTILNYVRKHVDMAHNIQKYSSVTLKVILTAKENRKYIAYATEPVIGSLANIMGSYPSDISKNHMKVLENIALTEMEIKYGVVTIAETLSYLHLYEGMIHCDVSPRNVIICQNGSWRLSGFHFIMRAESPSQLEFSHKPDTLTSDFLQPDINFSAPCLLMTTPTQGSDIFSLGMLITYVYNQGISLIEGTASTSVISRNSSKNVEKLYTRSMSSAYDAIKCDIPPGLRLGLSKLISFDIEVRPTAQQLLMLGYYNDPLIKYLKRINLYDNLPECDRESILSNELVECAKHLSQKMLVCHVLPILTKEVETGNRCAGVVQTLISCLSRNLSCDCVRSICQLVNQVLSCNATDFSTQAFSLLMDNICLLVSKRSPDTSLNDALPLLVQGLRSSTQMPAALNAVSQLSKQSQPLHTLTPGLIELLQQCMESHWSAGSVELCSQFLDAMVVWIQNIHDEMFTEARCKWLLKLMVNDFNILDIVSRALMTMLSKCDSCSMAPRFIKLELSPLIENLATSPDITQLQRQTLVQLARYAEHIVATLNKEVRIEDAPASDGCTTTTTTTILSIKTVVTNMLTTNSSTKRADLKRQAHVNEPTTEFRTPSSPSNNFPTFSFVITKPAEGKDKPTLVRPERSRTTDSEKRKKLFRMDVSPSRGNNRSFGELMADLDDRFTLNCEKEFPSSISKAGRAQSLQTPEDTRKIQRQLRWSSLQTEHFQLLETQATGDSSGPQANDVLSSSDNQVQTLTGDQTPSPKRDRVMKSLLQRLNSLTAQFNTKSNSSPQ